MSLQQLSVTDFRNFVSQHFQPGSAFNLICGPNGSGKTSLLEAIYFLAHGRSFRTARLQRMIRFDAELSVVHAKIMQADQLHLVGMQRSKQGELTLRLNGETAKRLADIAHLLPVQLITPDSFRIFFGGPKERRHFFDMGLFHVEPSFYQHWQMFSKANKQRNALLKQGATAEQFRYWDNFFCQSAEAITQLRQRYLLQLNDEFQRLVINHPLLSTIQLQFYPGWNQQLSLTDLLQQNRASDAKMGFTQAGPQKADLRIKVEQQPAEEVLSRGQLKMLLFALKIAQSNVIGTLASKQPILLIDDLASELDADSMQQVFQLLKTINSQVFVTAIEPDPVLHLMPQQSTAVFHVEHGTLTARTDDYGRT
ncbi:DNA replication/repair protein RecF [Alkalimonas sp. MEB108]|uniref:DNA replication and repair protein RecF n=1 Tax=Alkalimonas cellulosilytica TaxID=3058395 RepID=A0ABU7J833_9GAMM|nr:DNA replication/repair protein RecF [Alkalimonas sp. MEB108]MEE2002701.1 DNA replication/repair protein RecF [Alkalimonas sp. MEB108]